MSDPLCDTYRELVSAFVDESLGGEELLRLEAHLAGCPGCRDFEARLRRFRELLPAAEAFRPLRRPPPGFAAAVAARVAEQPLERLVGFPAVRTGRRVSGAGWLSLAAAAAAALVFAWSWQRLLPGESPEQKLASRPVPAVVMTAAADEGSIEVWMHEHTRVSRGGTMLGPAEEVEFASFHGAGVRER